MRITKVQFENFLTYQDKCELPFEQPNVIVGPNGAGKTNIIRALRLVSRLLAKQKQADVQRYAHDSNRPFSINLEIEFNDKEKQIMQAWLAFALISSDYDDYNVACTIREYVISDDILQKQNIDIPTIRNLVLESTFQQSRHWNLKLEGSWGECSYRGEAP